MILIGLLIATWPFDKVLTLLLFLFERFILELGSNTKKKRRGEMACEKRSPKRHTHTRTRTQLRLSQDPSNAHSNQLFKKVDALEIRKTDCKTQDLNLKLTISLNVTIAHTAGCPISPENLLGGHPH